MIDRVDRGVVKSGRISDDAINRMVEASDYGSWRTFLIVPEPPHEVLPELHPAGEPSAEAEAFYASLRRKIQCLRRLERAVRVGMVEDSR